MAKLPSEISPSFRDRQFSFPSRQQKRCQSSGFHCPQWLPLPTPADLCDTPAINESNEHQTENPYEDQPSSKGRPSLHPHRRDHPPQTSVGRFTVAFRDDPLIEGDSQARMARGSGMNAARASKLDAAL